MRLLVVRAGVTVALALTTFPVASAATQAERYHRAGLSVVLPTGWRSVARELSPCTNPKQRIAAVGRGALVQIVETLDYAYVHRFPPRPKRFALRGEPQFQACCPPRKAKGWFLHFRDGNRGFYAYVYLGTAGTRTEVLSLLDSLRVNRRTT